MSKAHNTIKARIRARKLTLSYFYWRIFVSRLADSDSLLESIIDASRGLENVHDKRTDDLPGEQRDLAQHLQASCGDNVDHDIEYVAAHYFNNWPIETIDMDYALRLARHFDEYYPLVQGLVNAHTTSFGFEQMDPVDQSLFVLGYEEWILIGTPKEVIINEVVELAKRYGDTGSPKLLHGIIHQLFQNKTS